jgi:hypothetical protein
VLSVRDVSCPKTLRHQLLDALADNFVVCVSKQSRDLSIRKLDDPEGIDDDHRIRGGIECAAGKV